MTEATHRRSLGLRTNGLFGLVSSKNRKLLMRLDADAQFPLMSLVSRQVALDVFGGGALAAVVVDPAEWVMMKLGDASAGPLPSISRFISKLFKPS